MAVVGGSCGVGYVSGLGDLKSWGDLKLNLLHAFGIWDYGIVFNTGSCALKKLNLQ